MRFIGNHPIPEHVNPPEDFTALDGDLVGKEEKASTEAATNVEEFQPKRKRGRPRTRKPDNSQAA